MARFLKNLFLIFILTSLVLSAPTHEKPEKDPDIHKGWIVARNFQNQVTPPTTFDHSHEDDDIESTVSAVAPPTLTSDHYHEDDDDYMPMTSDYLYHEDDEEANESDLTECNELISDPLLRSKLESLVSSSEVESFETFEASELINTHPVRNAIDKIVSTSDHLFNFPEGPKKYHVVVLPKGKGFHYIYKVSVFLKDQYSKPNVFKLIIVPGKTTKLGRKVTFIIIPKDVPESWK
ncbi:2345_t:CDS:2, partial [Gigaspora margarita]